MFVTLHVAVLLLLLSIIKNRSTSSQHVINNTRPHIFQYETSSRYDIQSSNETSSTQYIDHFESSISHPLSIANVQIERQSKAKNLIFKMSILSFPSVHHIQSYHAIYPSNISNLFVSTRCSRIYQISNALYLRIYTINHYKSNGIQEPRFSA